MSSKKMVEVRSSFSLQKRCSPMTQTSPVANLQVSSSPLQRQSWVPVRKIWLGPGLFLTNRCCQPSRNPFVFWKLSSTAATLRRSRCSRMTTRRLLCKSLETTSIWARMPWEDYWIRYMNRYRWMRTASHERNTLNLFEVNKSIL